MTTESKKPSELIREAAEYHLLVMCARPATSMQAEINEARAFLRFVLEYLDETEERLAKLERKTSSTEMVTLHEEAVEIEPGIFSGRSFRVRWHDPYPSKVPTLVRTRGTYEPDPEGSEEL